MDQLAANIDKAKLCKCTRCNAIMVDLNPKDQPELEVPDGVLDMEYFSEDGYSFTGCPNCLTDEHLIDVYEL